MSLRRPLIVFAALSMFVFAAAKTGDAVFANWPHARATTGVTDATAADASGQVAAPMRRRDDAVAAAGERPGADAPRPGMPNELVPARNTIVMPVAQATGLAAAVAAEAGAGSLVNAAASVNAPDTAALKDVSTQAAQVASSAELHQATTNLWTLAWQKSWPFVKDTTVKFFGLFRTLWTTLTTLGKTTGGANANVDVNAAAATNAAP